MTRAEEMRAKVERLQHWMERNEAEAVLFSRLENFAWLTAGGDAHVGLATEQAVASLLVTREGEVHLLANNIEAPRLLVEEMEELEVTPHIFPWHQERLLEEVRAIVGPGTVASDTPYPDCLMAKDSLQPLRFSLLKPEVERYRALGRDCGEVVAEVARRLEPGQTELHIAAQMAQGLLERNITPTVLLVAVDERTERFRHPIPTPKRLRQRAMLVAGGRRHGLIISLTRMVHFGPPPEALRRKHEAVAEVDATLIAHTRPGAVVGEILQRGIEAYERAGFSEEWRYHHQGGPTGYAPREYRATLGERRVVAPWQAFAWNPTIAGTKSEDTILATPQGPEVLSASPNWPSLSLSIGGMLIPRPDILVR